MSEQKANNYKSRRLSAIMFTDMVGYSALAQEDEERAIRLLEEHRSLLLESFKSFDGRVIDIIGDAFFVEFQSILGAANCAVDIQKNLHERNLGVDQLDIIRIRIGLHLGDVIHRDDQVIGDGVNIAARMEPLAAPGCICLSEDVVRQIKNKIDYPLRYLGQRELKNIQIPFRLYQIILPWEKRPSYPQKLLNILRDNKFVSSLLISIVMIFLISLIIIKPSNFSTIFSGDIGESRVIRHNRIAVLPFQNISADENNEYFADGLTEEIMSVLSRITKLNVIARTSIMRYKKSISTVSEIAEDLQVELVLEGSVRKEGEQIKVTVQLIDTKTEEQIYAETYQGKLSSVFEFQSDIALNVAQTLKINLASREQSEIKRQSTHDVKAYTHYLEGLYLLNKRNPESLFKGLKHFQESVKLDPGFALAYTGIADTYHLLSSYGLLSPEIGFEEGKKAALTAISIDDKLAQGYNSLAAIMLLYEWNWDESEKAFNTAIQFNPNHVQTKLWFALYHSIVGDYEKAISSISKAINLDPLSPIARTDLGQIYYFKGQFTEAVKEYEFSLSLDSNYVYTYAYLGQAYAVMGNLNKAKYAFKKALALTGGQDPAILAGLGYVYALQKKREEARAIIESLYKMDENLYIHPLYFSVIYIGLGEYDLALDWLERGFEDRSEWMVFLQNEHMLVPLHSEARYLALLKKMDF